MFNLARLRDDFNSAAARYDAHATLQQLVLARLLEKLGPIAPNTCVLDVGCGTGAFAHATGHSDLIALDNALHMCRQAGGAAVNADMHALPFANEAFDLVFSSLALQWANDWQQTLGEWLRVLKPGGRLAFSTFGAGTLTELAESFRVIDDYAHVSPFCPAEDIAAFLNARVEIETVTEYYPDMVTLARQLKALGARNKAIGQRTGLMTPRQFSRASQHYAATYATGTGLPARWNAVYVVMQKP